MNNDPKAFDVVVIGGGAAGMFAAGQAGSRGKRVLLLEKNQELGEKLKITGGGRCNITNDQRDVRTFLENYGQASDFLFSPFSQFGVEGTYAFFETRGLPLVVQARNRVFPQTEKAYDVYKTLKRNLEKTGVVVNCGVTVQKINVKDNRIISLQTNQGMISGKSFILATGGVSHPETGSTGDGFRFLTGLGHSVKQPTPSIVPLAVSDEWVKSLAGVSLSFMKISFYQEEKRQFSKTGKVLFTHFGLSGPLILNCAAQVGDLLQSGPVKAYIDSFPDTDLGAMDQKVVNLFNLNKNKELKTVFKELCPKGTSVAIASLLGDLDFTTKVHSVSKENRKRIVNLLKALPVNITNLMGYDRAVVADGGVSLKEVDTRTMQSKIISNLYIVGDLLDIKRPSGGYSLQLCWTTGFVAGNSA